MSPYRFGISRVSNIVGCCTICGKCSQHYAGINLDLKHCAKIALYDIKRGVKQRLDSYRIVKNKCENNRLQIIIVSWRRDIKPTEKNSAATPLTRYSGLGWLGQALKLFVIDRGRKKGHS
jgi:hypothetical protein